MPPRILAHTIPSVTGLIRCTVNESYNNQVGQSIIEARSTTLGLGDSITFNLGYSTGTTKVFTGYVREIEKDLARGTVLITCEDEMTKAVDFFIAADDPNEPFERFSISTQALIGDLLLLAQITDYSAVVPLSVTWATTDVPVEFNLVTVANAVNQIAEPLAWTVYAKRDGSVFLEDRKPYDMGSDSASFTWTLATGNILTATIQESTENLRNRVVVYGTKDVKASAQAVSPYLPAGFFKSGVLASPLFTTQGFAQDVADLNLPFLNRLTESAAITIEGDPTVKPRIFADVTIASIGMSGLWFIYQVEHVFDSSSGYTQNLTLTR